MDISEAQVSEIRQLLSGWPDLQAAYIFGSRARGDAHKNSDLDLAVRFSLADDIAEMVLGEEGLAWQRTLSSKLGLEVRLALLRGDTTPIHEEAVKRDGIRVFP